LTSGEDKAETWDWTENQLTFLQLIEQNMHREQLLGQQGVQLNGMQAMMARIDILAEMVLTEEGIEEYHMQFALKVSEALDNAALDNAEKELNKAKLLTGTQVDISQLNRADRRRRQREAMKNDSKLIRPN
jgi:hypothetical protein